MQSVVLLPLLCVMFSVFVRTASIESMISIKYVNNDVNRKYVNNSVTLFTSRAEYPLTPVFDFRCAEADVLKSKTPVSQNCDDGHTTTPSYIDHV
jgi:hypothetical protein